MEGEVINDWVIDFSSTSLPDEGSKVEEERTMEGDEIDDAIYDGWETIDFPSTSHHGGDIEEEDEEAKNSFSPVTEYHHQEGGEGGRAEKEEGLRAANRDEFALQEIVKKRVLPLLPAKVLYRFKSVSTDWNQWISSPFFAHGQFQFFKSLSGVFYHSLDGSPVYASFDDDDFFGTTSFDVLLPEAVDVRASCNGLLCCRGKVSECYYMCNPATKVWASLPSPPAAHGDNPAVVIVFEEPLVYNFSAEYNLVCGFQIRGLERVYAFHVFSSKSWQWRISKELCPLNVLPESGVGVGGKAFWRSDIFSVVCYVPEVDVCRVVGWPAGDEGNDRWEIGELGQKLCCVWAAERKAVVYVMKEGWEMVGTIVGGDWSSSSPWPLRCQGSREVLLWFKEEGEVVAVDAKNMGTRRLGEWAPSRDMALLPYISSLVVVKRGPVFDSVV